MWRRSQSFVRLLLPTTVNRCHIPSRYISVSAAPDLNDLWKEISHELNEIRLPSTKKFIPEDFDVLFLLQRAGSKYGVKIELIDGKIFMHGMATPRHNAVVANVIKVCSRGEEQWTFIPDAHLGPRLLPDIAGWRKPNSYTSKAQSGITISVMPDWVCEVLSPSTSGVDWSSKRNAYAELGIPHYWIADPEKGMIHVLSLQSDKYVESCVAAIKDTEIVLQPFEEPFNLRDLYDYL